MEAGPAVILFGHGSRDPLWRAPIEAVAARIAAREPARAVRCAYLEFNQPDLPAAVRDLAVAGALQVSILPMFLGTGKHAREDLPTLIDQLRVDHPGMAFTLHAAVGENTRLLDLLADIALGTA